MVTPAFGTQPARRSPERKSASSGRMARVSERKRGSSGRLARVSERKSASSGRLVRGSVRRSASSGRLARVSERKSGSSGRLGAQKGLEWTSNESTRRRFALRRIHSTAFCAPEGPGRIHSMRLASDSRRADTPEVPGNLRTPSNARSVYTIVPESPLRLYSRAGILSEDRSRRYHRLPAEIRLPHVIVMQQLPASPRLRGSTHL